MYFFLRQEEGKKDPLITHDVTFFLDIFNFCSNHLFLLKSTQYILKTTIKTVFCDRLHGQYFYILDS